MLCLFVYLFCLSFVCNLDEVTRNMMAKEQSIRDENNQKYLVLEKAIKAELEARLQYERDVRQYLEGRWKQYADELDAIKVSQQV